MPTDKLSIALAGNLPYYEPTSASSSLRNVVKYVWDYRTRAYNDPVGKTAYFFLKGLQTYHESGGRGVEVHFWGSISPEYHKLVSSMGLQDVVDISGFIPKSDSLDKLNSADILLLTLALGVAEYRPFSLPGKMYDYFALAKPIFAPIQESQCADILRKSGLGIVVDPLDPSAIAAELEHLAENRAELSSLFQPDRAYLQRFESVELCKGMAQLFDEL